MIPRLLFGAYKCLETPRWLWPINIIISSITTSTTTTTTNSARVEELEDSLLERWRDAIGTRTAIHIGTRTRTAAIAIAPLLLKLSLSLSLGIVLCLKGVGKVGLWWLRRDPNYRDPDDDSDAEPASVEPDESKKTS